MMSMEDDPPSPPPLCHLQTRCYLPSRARQAAAGGLAVTPLLSVVVLA
jgi:hypothetical protein